MARDGPRSDCRLGAQRPHVRVVVWSVPLWLIVPVVAVLEKHGRCPTPLAQRMVEELIPERDVTLRATAVNLRRTRHT